MEGWTGEVETPDGDVLEGVEDVRLKVEELRGEGAVRHERRGHRHVVHLHHVARLPAVGGGNGFKIVSM